MRLMLRYPLDVLTYEEKTPSAILRIYSSGQIVEPLTLLGSYKGKNYAFRVIQVSPLLLAYLAIVGN